jgi:DNA polymerase
MLFADLPSGHSLAYPSPEIKLDMKFGKEGLTFKAPENTGKMLAQRTWGGTLVENLVQAIARDCLAENLLRLDAAGFAIPLHVHDEVVLDVPIGESSVEEVTEIMGQEISWAPGLPLKAAGFECEFYQKD